MAILVRCESCQKQFRTKNSSQGKKTKCPGCGESLTLEGKQIPDFDVFISHSSKDEAAANAVLNHLENRKFRCWIAPRDIKGGKNWSSAIIEAIENCRTMVLIFSSHANLSQQVLREVERAVAKEVVIVPFRIDDVPMTQELEYYLSTSHWLDALNGPEEKDLDRLTDSLKSIVDENSDATQKLSYPSGSTRTTESKQNMLLTWPVMLVASSLILGGVFLVFLLFSGGDDDRASASAPVEPAPASGEEPLSDPKFLRKTNELTSLIQDNVTPGEWTDSFGEQSLFFFDSLMLVSATERTHRKTEEYLAELRQAKSLPATDVFKGLNPEVRQTLQTLDRSAERDWIDVPLSEVVDYLRQVLGVPIHLNVRSLESFGLSTDEPVTFYTPAEEKIRWRNALDYILEHVGGEELTWTVMNGGTIQVLVQSDLRWGLPIRVYDVGDLLGQRTDTLKPRWLLGVETETFVKNSIAMDSWDDLGGYGVIRFVDPSFSVKNLLPVHRRFADTIQQIRRLRGIEAPENWMSLSESERRLESIWKKISSLDLSDFYAEDAITLISDTYSIQIRVNENDLQDSAISLDQEVSIKGDQMVLADLLEIFCNEIHPELIFDYSDGFYLLTTRSALAKKAESRFYRVSDLLENHPEGTPEQRDQYEKSLIK